MYNPLGNLFEKDSYYYFVVIKRRSNIMTNSASTRNKWRYLEILVYLHKWVPCNLNTKYRIRYRVNVIIIRNKIIRN